jgi:ketosteroid isomerase-like protein
MMADNSEIIKACRLAFTGYEKNDKSLLLTILADDVVFDFPTSLPYGGKYVGLKGFKDFWADLYETYYDYFNYDAIDVLDAGTHVIVPVVARARAKNGRTMENQHCFLFKVQAGRIVYGRIYADTAKGRDLIEGLERSPSRASG